MCLHYDLSYLYDVVDFSIAVVDNSCNIFVMINTFNIFPYNMLHNRFVFFILAIHLIFIENLNLFIYIFGRITIISEFF